MNLITIFNQFPNQQSCIAHLESIRWPEQAFCPLCDSDRVARKVENEVVGRWNCHKCKSSFKCVVGYDLQRHSSSLTKVVFGDWLNGTCKKRACPVVSLPVIWR